MPPAAATARKPIVVDGDGHLLEPKDLWTRNVSRKFKEIAPRVYWDNEKKGEGYIADGSVITPAPRAGDVGCARWSPDRRRLMGVGSRYDDGPAAGFHPDARAWENDREGIDIAVMYPTLGLFLGSIENAELAVECCRIYNDWLADWCSKQPKRFVGVAALPMQDPQAAAKEARRCVEKLGMRGGFVRPNPYKGNWLHNPVFDVVWAELQDMNVPLAIHPSAGGVGMGAMTFYRTDWGRVPGYKVFAFLFDNYFAVTALVNTGMLDRFPKLKLLVLESGGGWVLHWLDQMDHWLCEVNPQERDRLSADPSKIFKRQVYISVDPDEKSVPSVIKVLGDKKLIWASDYPHTDVTAPSVVAEVRQHLKGMPRETQKRLLGQNALDIYGIRNRN